jgi:ATP phosphoribosyltransferase
VFTRIAAEEEARTTREVRAVIDPARPLDIEGLAAAFAAALPFGPPAGSELVLRCRADDAFRLVEALLSGGAEDVTVRSVDYIFRKANPLMARLRARVG